MAETNIEWAHYTFNPWRGCTKCSPACDICYAEAMSKRNPAVFGVWGKYGTRSIAAESYWRLPEQWNRKAEKEGFHKRVFCASLADVFEGPESMPVDAWEAVSAARERLGHLIDATPWLDWLLLTKRPENVLKFGPLGYRWSQDPMPDNVWIGTTVENQKYADIRIPELLKIPAKVRFLSVEPMLEPVGIRTSVEGYLGTLETASLLPVYNPWDLTHTIDWVICGGESGAGARPMHPDWARSLRDQCTAAGVPFFFKQWGQWWPMSQTPDFWVDQHPRYAKRSMILQRNGDDIGKQFPVGAMTCFNVGKEISGRVLDGRTWDEMPIRRVIG